QLDLDALARLQLVRGLRGAPADEHVAVFNRALERRAAHRSDARGEEGVEPRARLRLGNFERERPGFRAGGGFVTQAFALDAGALVAHALAVSAARASSPSPAAACARFARRRRRKRKTRPPMTTRRLMSCEVERPVRVVRPAMSPRGSSRTNSMRKRVSP